METPDKPMLTDPITISLARAGDDLLGFVKSMVRGKPIGDDTEGENYVTLAYTLRTQFYGAVGETLFSMMKELPALEDVFLKVSDSIATRYPQARGNLELEPNESNLFKLACEEFSTFKRLVQQVTPTHVALQAHLDFFFTIITSKVDNLDMLLFDPVFTLRDEYFSQPSEVGVTNYLNSISSLENTAMPANSIRISTQAELDKLVLELEVANLLSAF